MTALVFYRSSFVNSPIKVAFFPDSFLEVNGAAMTCRRLVDYAKENDRPMLVVHADKRSREWSDGCIEYLSLKRSPLAIKLDEELAYDPLFQRHTNKALRALMDFRPDVIHITGLNDVGIVGAYLAWKLQIPLIGSWHTNLHEFAAERLKKLLRFLPAKMANSVVGLAERKILDGAILYYKMPKVVLAPNQELIDMLGKGTNRTARLMARGVDTTLFAPEKRTVSDGIFRIGFVGRLRPEKNVALLIDLERELLAAGEENFRFLIVGEGSERAVLEEKLKFADFTGFIAGEELSEAYANMDVFLFPSETDAYGNVIQEAAASGVPSIVSDKGGPKFLVEEVVTGFVASGLPDFVRFTRELLNDRARLERMRIDCRRSALSKSWNAVFEGVFDAYAETISLSRKNRRVDGNGRNSE